MAARSERDFEIGWKLKRRGENMRLYEINDQIYKLLNQEIVDPETGEIFDVNGFDQLKELETKREDKLEKYSLVYQEFRSGS